MRAFMLKRDFGMYVKQAGAGYVPIGETTLKAIFLIISVKLGHYSGHSTIFLRARSKLITRNPCIRLSTYEI
jgi:hypothetical protein